MGKNDWNHCFSGIRFGEESEMEPSRTQYERDYDRIIYSSPFRRLQNKTQVFPLPDAIFVHNRLTHSLEVASVGRTLGKLAGQDILSNENLTESAKHFYSFDLPLVVSAACLAHDIGNPPFGHSGETAISEYFKDFGKDAIDGIELERRFSDEEWQDFLHFEGNANGFRLLTHHFPTRLSGGFRLTYTTLAAMAKYPCESSASDKTKGLHRKKFGFFQADKQRFIDMATRLHLNVDAASPLSYYRHPFTYLVEAADDICYLIMDWEDAHRLGIIRFEQASEKLLDIIQPDGEEKKRIHSNLRGLESDKNESIAYLRAKAIGTLVRLVVKVFHSNRSTILQGKLNASLMDCIPNEIKIHVEEIQRISKQEIYRHPSVAKIEVSGYEIMHGLLSSYLPAVLKKRPNGKEKSLMQLVPAQFHCPIGASDYEKTLAMLDYLSGMTDIYALQVYQQLKGIRIQMYS